MASQRERDATDYLEKHKILELVENLTSMLLFHKPGEKNPREFLVEQLEQLKIYGSGPELFNSSNVTAVLRILDPMNKQYITFAQYKHGECCMQCWVHFISSVVILQIWQQFVCFCLA
uniref:Uncharacterized protein n=1 Tax=Nothobranchius furzeri TaxID=105023 RepID=A0A8C6LPY7_NOTFU